MSNLTHRVKGKIQEFAGKRLHAAIDGEPHESSGVLRGWAVEKAGPVFFEVVIDGQTIFSFSPEYARLDVYKCLPQFPLSLISGFELKLPQHLLQHIGKGRLWVNVVASFTKEKIWAWEFGEETEQEDSCIQELIAELQKNGPHLLQDPHIFKKKRKGGNPLHIVLETSGQYIYLLRSLRRICEKNFLSRSSSCKLASLTVLAVEPASREEVCKLLETIEVPKEFNIRVEEQSNCKSFEDIFSPQDAYVEELVFFSEESVDLQYIDFEALVADFLAFPEIPLLMPTPYGRENGICGPLGVDLFSLRQSTRLKGRDMPVLYPTKKLGPTWLSTFAFLEREEQENGLCFTPREDVSLYHLDLRQPITWGGRESSKFPALCQKPLQMIFYEEVEDISCPSSNSEISIIVIPEEWDARDSQSGTQFQILELARKLRRQGGEVVFVHDFSSDSWSYIEGFASIPIGKFQESSFAFEKGWIIAASWSALRAAHTLRYLTGFPVAGMIQSLGYLEHEKKNPEKLELAHWASKGTFLPIINNQWVCDGIPKECDGKEFTLTLPLAVNEEFFQKLPLRRKKGSLLCLFDSHDEAGFCSVFELAKVLERLKTQSDISQITLATTSCGGKDLTALLQVCDEVFEDLGAADCARLYAMHEFVLDVKNHFGINLAPLEAAACGAIPFVLDERGLSDSSLHTSLEELPKKLKAGVLCDTPLEGEFPSSFFHLLSKKHEEMNAQLLRQRSSKNPVTIVLPVYNALEATSLCVRKLIEYLPDDYSIIIVNDASDEGVTSWLENVTQQSNRIRLLNLKENRGFIGACTAGVEAANPESDVLLVNSDVIVSKNALQYIREAAYARPDIGFASSLSSNSPNLQVDLNPGDSLETAAEKISTLCSPSYPTVVTTEGQFLYIRRWVLEKFGFFDPVYNKGFCEESDLCMRAFLHGADMVCADNALILHMRSMSFGKDTRSKLISENRPIFDARWGRYYMPMYRTFLERDPLKGIRQKYRNLSAVLEKPREFFESEVVHNNFKGLKRKTIYKSPKQNVLGEAEAVFILPSIVHGGGTLSVLQHVDELLMRSIEARVVVLQETDVTYRPYLSPSIPVSIEQLLELDWKEQKVVATFWTTAYAVKALKQRYPQLDAYYYIQDYEPWFYSRPTEFPTVQKVEATYDFGLRGVVKTEYLRDLIKHEHHIDVSVINPGLDKTLFYPGQQRQHIGRPRIAALFRSETPRRGNRELLEVFRRVRARVPEAEIKLFGDDKGLPEEFEKEVSLLGQLTPAQVGRLYRETDVVVDLSYWHGFGRMGIEGMACGAVPVLSQSGGVARYAKNSENAFLVDAHDFDAVADKIVLLLKNSELRRCMRAKGLETAEEFGEAFAVDDWLQLWGRRHLRAVSYS